MRISLSITLGGSEREPSAIEPDPGSYTYSCFHCGKTLARTDRPIAGFAMEDLTELHNCPMKVTDD